MEEKDIKTQLVDIDDLTQDRHNFNRGTDEGQQLMERSFQDLGAGRSILVDRHGNIIAGNKSQRAAKAAGIKKVRVIETDGTELIAVKRTDVDIDSAEGRKMALLDNLTTQVNLSWDETEIQTVTDEVEGFSVPDFGFDPQNMPSVSFGDDGVSNTPSADGEDADGDGEGSEGNGETKDNYNIIYSLVFNTEEEQDIWFKFLRKLKNRYPDLETISERVISYIQLSDIWQE